MDLAKDQLTNQGSDQFLRAAHYTTWQLIKAYWQSPERVSAYLFFALILIMTVSLVGIDVVLNYWYNHFYNALQAYDKRGAIQLLVVFFGIAFVYIIVAVYRYYVSQLFALRWRRWLTTQFIGRWLNDKGYYYLESFDPKTDNPDQRIQEDAGAIVTSSIELTTGLITAVTTMIGFMYVLWSLSGVLIIPLGSLGTLRIPGYLVWVGLLYNLIGSLLAFKIGRPLIGLNFEQQRREATFRFAATDLRVHAENVAFYHGEAHQKNILQRLFGGVLANWYEIILRQKKLLWFTAGFNQTAVVLPLLVALPNYFDKVFLLGGLMQSIQAFNRVQESLAFLVNSYSSIASWQAVSRRLTTFANHLNEVEIKAQTQNKLHVQEVPQNMIQASNVTISTPRQNILLKDINEKFIHGEHYVIKGQSGLGKSTFLRALAGLWPFASGGVLLPAKQSIMYLPQSPYMPIGKLADAILFPDHVDAALESELVEILRACRLENLIPRLHEEASWSEQLSPGEQQRVAFARVLLHKPDWIIMDESTSMLDLANENYLYQLLKTRLPHCSIVSVGHRPSLDAHHDHVVDMARYQARADAIA